MDKGLNYIVLLTWASRAHCPCTTIVPITLHCNYIYCLSPSLENKMLNKYLFNWGLNLVNFFNTVRGGCLGPTRELLGCVHKGPQSDLFSKFLYPLLFENPCCLSQSSKVSWYPWNLLNLVPVHHKLVFNLSYTESLGSRQSQISKE